MIVLDASAVIAILNQESNFEALIRRLVTEPQRCISPVSALEVTMVLSRRYVDPAQEADAYFRQENIAIDPIDGTRAEWAQYAFQRFGRGRHPARLSLGDCFSYAAAKALDAPLLYVGNNFAQTDLRAA
ncbi:MAG: type II toxin-antitoxin system VapC family toxin [Alphaproteobacteria bacterium]|nr:type II toxin-antitoxin system VapC family toxin [Alphaproteobacteria bacterium]MBL7099704.1 type II toxin-antitoxin system VapC family toxin [Alphaproteobacteria bacterium]